MDFQKLLKKAANNQASKEKELESRRKEIKHERQSSKLQEIEKKREARKKLGAYEEETIKSRLVYHGLMSSSGTPVATSSATTTSKSTASLKVSNDSSTRHSHAAGSGKNKEHLSSFKGSKSKSLSPMPPSINTLVKKKVASKNSLSNQITTKSKTPPPGKLKSSSMPTDFQELLKLAQKNSVGSKTLPVSGFAAVPQKASTKESGLTHKVSSAPASVGIGKSLVHRSAKLDKDKTVQPHPSDKILNGNVQVGQGKKSNGEHKSSLPTVNKGKNSIKNSSPSEKGKQSSSGSIVSHRVDPYPRPYPRPYPKTTVSGHEQQQQSSQRDGVKGSVKSQSGSMPADTAQMRNQGRPPSFGAHSSRGRGRGISRNPNKFYSASARLITDGSSTSSSRLPMLGYRSTWADEMSEYLRNNQYDLEEEDEDEFDDFVVDEVEEGYDNEVTDNIGEDYSSAIRSIFGDRYRVVNDDDGEVMESSYAQQQFEEMRSARIGRMEDEEDVRREKEELDRKRKHKATNDTSKKFKQSGRLKL